MLETVSTTATEEEFNAALDALGENDYTNSSDQDIADDVADALAGCGDVVAVITANGLWDFVIGKVVGWIRGIWEKIYDWSQTVVDRFLQSNKIFTFTPPSGNGPGL